MAFSISVTAFCWTTRPSLLRALFFSTLVLTVAYFESLVQTPTHPCDTIHTRCRSSLDYSSEPAHSFHVLFVPAVAPSWIAHPSLRAISMPFRHPLQSPFGWFIRTCTPFQCSHLLDSRPLPLHLPLPSLCFLVSIGRLGDPALPPFNVRLPGEPSVLYHCRGTTTTVLTTC